MERSDWLQVKFEKGGRQLRGQKSQWKDLTRSMLSSEWLTAMWVEKGPGKFGTAVFFLMALLLANPCPLPPSRSCRTERASVCKSPAISLMLTQLLPNMAFHSFVVLCLFKML